ncbi:Hypothetical predicted protein [Lecanosticta acicola]|uniref:Uncharacterized protein n=1 Tax=Lecanosticta acicola TaxID=111012 RepID=A0AAI8Z551_9PEZI|nr:Hypothetical predicted protein [Lecanosticta acicola]
MLSRLFGLVRPARTTGQPTLEKSVSPGTSEKKAQVSTAAPEAIETADSTSLTASNVSIGTSNVDRPSGAAAAIEICRSQQLAKDGSPVSADLEKSETATAKSDLVPIQTTKGSEDVSAAAIVGTPEACEAASSSTPSTGRDNLSSVTIIQPQTPPDPVTPTSSPTSGKKRKYDSGTALVQTPRKKRARKPWQAHSVVFKLDPSISHASPSSVVSMPPVQSTKQPPTALPTLLAPVDGFMDNSSSNPPFLDFGTFESSSVQEQQSQQSPAAFSSVSSEVCCTACRSVIPGYHIPGCREGGRHSPHASWGPGGAVDLAQTAHTVQKPNISGTESYTNEQASSDGLTDNGTTDDTGTATGQSEFSSLDDFDWNAALMGLE